VAATPAASARLLDFLACHRSTVETASWFGGPSDLRMFSLPDKIYRTTLDEYWMLRIVDVAAALSQRGYPDVELELELELTDAFLPENSGAYRLRVSGGRAEVSRIERTTGVRLDAGALAAIYAGFLAPRELFRAGRIQGDARSLATFGLLFSGPAPSLSDFF
jgi:predicted acetyltransferase